MDRQNVTQMVTTHPIVKSLMKRVGVGRLYKDNLHISFLLSSPLAPVLFDDQHTRTVSNT
jgi:hypothetical protein